MYTGFVCHRVLTKWDGGSTQAIRLYLTPAARDGGRVGAWRVRISEHVRDARRPKLEKKVWRTSGRRRAMSRRWLLLCQQRFSGSQPRHSRGSDTEEGKVCAASRPRRGTARAAVRYEMRTSGLVCVSRVEFLFPRLHAFYIVPKASLARSPFVLGK